MGFHSFFSFFFLLFYFLLLYFSFYSILYVFLVDEGRPKFVFSPHPTLSVKTEQIIFNIKRCGGWGRNEEMEEMAHRLSDQNPGLGILS